MDIVKAEVSSSHGRKNNTYGYSKSQALFESAH